MDESRVEREGLIGPQAESLHRPRSEVLHEHVRAADELTQHSEARLALQVEHDALFTAIEPHEVARHAVHGLVVAAGEVAGVPLYFNHPGAEVGQLAGGKGRGNSLLEGDDSEPGQR